MVVPTIRRVKRFRQINKKRRLVVRKSYGMKKIAKMIKKISLKNAETKNTHQIVENTDLYHNLETVTTGLLYTRQGLADNNTGTSSYSSRIGDEVIGRGIQLKFWFATKSDRPNVMFKIVVFKYFNAVTPPNTVYKSQGSSNRMIRDIDTEKLKIVKVKMFNLQTGLSGVLKASSASGTYNPVDKEAHKYVKMYIPLRNMKIKYQGDDSGLPQRYDYGISIVPYDSYGTLTTDIVASYAYNAKFYFKDP